MQRSECSFWIPTFYQRRDAFVGVMRHAIALNGSFFTAQRMLQEYVEKAYDLTPTAEDLPVSALVSSGESSR